MRAKHLVVVGASSGGIETLRELVAKLPAEFPAPIAVGVWNAIRSMHEGSMLMRGMARHAEEAHPASETAKLTKRAKELERQGDVLREMVTGATEISS